MAFFLKQPYPFPNTEPTKILIEALLIGSSVTIFLVLIRPFGIPNYSFFSPQMLYLASFGLVTFFVMLVYRIILLIFLNKKLENNWSVGHEIVAQIILLIGITFGNVFYSNILNKSSHFSYHYLIEMLGYTLAVAIVPIFISVFLNYRKLMNKYATANSLHKIDDAKPINDDITTENTNDNVVEKVIFMAENNKDSFECDAEQLMCIESTDNYVSIYYVEEKGVQRKILRTNLSKIEEQLQAPNIRRVHRSFIANFELVNNLTGNAQGYKLHFDNWEEVIPVSRQFSKIVLEYFR